MSDAADRLSAMLGRIPYARFLGVEVSLHGDEMTGVLPFSPRLIGNPLLPAIHGGVIGAFESYADGSFDGIRTIFKPDLQEA